MAKPRSLPHRIAGDLSLDLVNTYSWRGTDREIDHLANADDVLAWAREVRLIKAGITFSAAQRKSLLEEVHALRRAIEGAGVAVAHGQEPPPAALAAIRDAAARSLGQATLSGAPAELEFDGIDRILGPLAWAALDLLRGDELDRLKQCPPDDCRWLFIDRTKNGSRRWCDMGTCGNRAKKRSIK